MAKLRVYLDTTVYSAAEDMRSPDRMVRTLEFFARAEEFDLYASTLTRDELQQTPDAERRATLLARLTTAKLLSIDLEMETLADRYVEMNILPSAYRDDALHIAVAVLSELEVIASWNFRHLVNRRRRSLVNLLNVSLGLRQIEIVTPSEL